MTSQPEQKEEIVVYYYGSFTGRGEPIMMMLEDAGKTWTCQKQSGRAEWKPSPPPPPTSSSSASCVHSKPPATRSTCHSFLNHVMKQMPSWRVDDEHGAPLGRS
uniref:Uncharacterized protein n=1 Tax=Lotharella oceanica TaxID=641309 RepID=A0A7S2U3A6_9EUKA